MRARHWIAALAFGAAAVGPVVTSVTARPAAAAEQAKASPSDSMSMVEGEVTKIDLERNRVTIRSDDGSVHEFEASAETLKELKVGDRIQAKRRAAND